MLVCCIPLFCSHPLSNHFFLSRHPAVENLDYYWRIEAGTEYVCPIAFDPFQYMKDHNKKVSFSMALYEYHETLPTLWNTVKEFASEHPEWVVENKEGSGSLWPFVTDTNSGDFNRCHFWSNFQVCTFFLSFGIK
jgi:alpha 1,2-mannosyltransferase